MIIALDTSHELIERVSALLQKGDVVALPTDTVYGLAVDSFLQPAVDRLTRLKNRETKPFTYFLSKDRITHFAQIVHQRIIETCMPGALTVILLKKEEVDLPSMDRTIGIRIPDTPFILDLLGVYERPLAVSSANRSGEKPLISACEIAEQFTEIPLVINGGTLVSLPSTVIDLTCTPPVIRRKGAVSIPELELVYGDLLRMDPAVCFNILFICTGNTCRSPMAEGLLRTLVNKNHCEVRSAGIIPMEGMPASQHAQSIVQEHGGSIKDHQSQPVTPALITWADIIFVMGKRHLDHVRQLSPRAAGKTFFLKEYKQKVTDKEVHDPVGKDLTVYRSTVKEMLAPLQIIAREAKQRSEESN